MGDTKLSFRRYEKKYLLTAEQYQALFPVLRPYIQPDEYPESTVCSLYYDGDDYHLIRHSIDDPVYKEKLRLRSYNVPGPEDTVFVEIKKKFKGVVYKRRVTMSARAAEEYLSGHIPAPEQSQTIREIDWFMAENRPRPKVFIACDRSAWRGRENPELRITFDRDIRWRETELSLMSGSQGSLLLEEGQVLMETKIPGAAPLWLARIFSELGLFSTGFSKYGTCYKGRILGKYLNGVI